MAPVETASFLDTYLPGPGLLPKWLLLVSVIAVGNTLQSYSTTTFSRRVYAGRPFDVTPLSSRTFGTWTFLSALIRGYCAYNTSNTAVYDLCVWSYVIANLHFVSEWLVFGTAVMGKGLAGPAVVSTLSVAWMLAKRAEYTGEVLGWFGY